MKKILLSLVIITVIAAGTLFIINGKDTYQADKYSASLSNGLQKGSKVSFTLPDQFDKSHTLDNSISTIIFVSSKATGHEVKEFLKEKPADYLQKHHALFVADISPMPVVIRNTFALPDLKKQHYSVLLIYDKEFAKNFKKGTVEDKIAIVELKNGIVSDLKFIEDDDDIEKALEK